QTAVCGGQRTEALSLSKGRVVAKPRERVAWIDLYRGMAVLVMIETHVVNSFMAEALRHASWFSVLNYLNGLVAPSFLFIAGFVQGLERGGAPEKPLNYARRSRLLLLIA